MPIDAASLQPSSRLVPRAKTPLVTPCFNRPVLFFGADICANAAEVTADADAKAGRKSLRRMKHEYHSAPFGARVRSITGLLDSKNRETLAPLPPRICRRRARCHRAQTHPHLRWRECARGLGRTRARRTHR